MMMALWILFCIVVSVSTATYGYKNRKWSIYDREDYYQASFAFSLLGVGVGGMVYVLPWMAAVMGVIAALAFSIRGIAKRVEASRDAGN